MNQKVYISNPSCITPLGTTLDENFNTILQGKSAIQSFENHPFFPKPFCAAIINDNLLNKEFQTENEYSRLEKMCIISLSKTIFDKELPKSKDSLLIISTTKGNISNLGSSNSILNENVFLDSVGLKIQHYFGFYHKPIVVSNACVSGVLAISMAYRLLKLGKYKNILVVGADEISAFILSGFESFQALSPDPCKPYSKHRVGVSLGEAAASVLVSSEDAISSEFEILGESSINDANHISGPSRTGEGLYQSIERAKKEAKITSKDIQFISAHGTATLFNDEMEAIAFNRCDLQNVPLHSLKGYFGHTLGASGVLEMVLSMKMVQENRLIKSLGFDELGVSQSLNVIKENTTQKTAVFLKTASGFGGTNAAIIVKKQMS